MVNQLVARYLPLCAQWTGPIQAWKSAPMPSSSTGMLSVCLTRCDALRGGWAARPWMVWLAAMLVQAIAVPPPSRGSARRPCPRGASEPRRWWSTRRASLAWSCCPSKFRNNPAKQRIYVLSCNDRIPSKRAAVALRFLLLSNTFN